MGSKKKGSKKKREEAQKVKLKVGRQLTKSNMTSTAFKSGRIVLGEQIAAYRALTPQEMAAEQARNAQLASGNNAPAELTSMQLAVFEDQLRDAVNKLTHCSSAARFKAIKFMQKMLNRRSSFIAERLHDLLQRILLLLRDSDGVVRQATRALLCDLVSKLTESQMEPHWPKVAKHLSCIFTQSSDMNLHSECVNLLRHFSHARPRAAVSHCTVVASEFVNRLAGLPPAKLVPYLTVGVGDGSLLAIANSVKHSEPLVERFLHILSHCQRVGEQILQEKKTQKTLLNDNSTIVVQDDTSIGFSAKHIDVKLAQVTAPLSFFVYSPLSTIHRMQMLQFASPAVQPQNAFSNNNKKDGSENDLNKNINSSASMPITFSEKVEELGRLIENIRKLKK